MPGKSPGGLFPQAASVLREKFVCKELLTGSDFLYQRYEG